jgi:endonuclease/exonuclease/phosphatase family metal-dependent hydrolase
MTRKLRILSWNIHKGIGGVDRRYELPRVVEVLKHYDADVLLLQEVAQGMPKLKHDDQAALLAEALGMHFVFAPEHQFAVGGYGNLILARWPIVDSSHVDLTVGWRKKRGALQARIRAQVDGQQHTLVVHNMHLGLAGSERGVQLEQFLSCQPFRGIHRATPVIVGGDLNDLWGSLGPSHLLPAGFERAGKPQNTFPAVLPLRPLDGLFFRGNLKLNHFEVGRTQLTRVASDHLPIYADFTPTEGSAPPTAKSESGRPTPKSADGSKA